MNNLIPQQNDGIFFRSETETLSWQELRDFQSAQPSYLLENKNWAALSSESVKNMLLGIWQLWQQNKAAIILDPRIDQVKKDQIYELLEKHLQDQCPQTLFLLSSGSSGELKLIGLHSHAIQNSAQMTLDFYQDLAISHWGLNLPVHHVGGMMILWRMLKKSGQVTQGNLNELLLLAPNLEAISLVPTQLQKCIDSQEQLTALKKMKLILLGGAACPPELYQSILAHKLPVSLTYGATETCSQVFATKTKSEKLSVGYALPWVELISPQGTEVELVSLKSPTLFHALINSQGLQIFDPQRIYQSNDLGLLDVSKELIIKGRSDEIFISGGENISPEEIEGRLKACPGIEEVLLCPRPDKTFGQLGHLFYRGQGVDLREKLQDFILQNLLPHERPKSLSILPDSLMGPLKPLRQKAREMVNSWMKQSQTPLLFLHGFMGHPYDFDALFEQLIQQGVAPWRLKALSLPGHSQNSLNTSTVDFKTYLDQLEQQYQKEFAQPFILYGYSLGARLAFQLCLRANIQKNCEKLFFEGGHFGLEEEQEKSQRLKADESLFDPNADDQEFESFLAQWHQMELFQGLTQSPYFPAHLKRKKTRHQRTQLHRTLKLTSTGAQPTTAQDLKKYKIHPVYFTGELDTKYNHYAAQLQAQGMIHHISVAQASHNIHLMNPDILAQKIFTILGS